MMATRRQRGSYSTTAFDLFN